MPTGLSLHVGINQADPVFETVVLQGCVKDAQAMFELASTKGFWARKLLDEEATFDNVNETISWAASILKDGDIFLFTFAGHGSFQSNETIDLGNDEIEDQTILLRDCVLVDNYIRRNLWTQFKPGVRILGIVDSCHSGSVLTANLILDSPILNGIASGMNMSIDAPANAGGGGSVAVAVEPHIFESVVDVSAVVPAGGRGFTDEQRRNIENSNPALHQKIRDSLLPANTPLNAKVLSLAACQDNESAADGPNHGKFTQALLDIFDGGAFSTYQEFMNLIQTRIGSLTQAQHPALRPQVPDALFVNEQPFTI